MVKYKVPLRLRCPRKAMHSSLMDLIAATSILQKIISSGGPGTFRTPLLSHWAVREKRIPSLFLFRGRLRGPPFIRQSLPPGVLRKHPVQCDLKLARNEDDGSKYSGNA
ncbi:hypothetical protein CEXT_746901 [Caerostris extrusa]|uniref:Uncharacterized protein n=1 Tax=Caerostris extrusa TaxID=172846 RepID=A0AAV4TEQ7_CAEEX|nr:hypothetical protein CEXT_746901 [Caerostris extrusa]